MPADITIGTPVFGGAPFLPETLACIRRQTYPNFRVEISVDAGDRDSLSAIRPFLGDSRFTVQQQERRLGWKGNLNQLMRNARTDFFCYWQQDDFAADNYLEQLRRAALADPHCAVAFAPMQSFGTRIHIEPAVSCLGPPVDRLLAFIEQPMHVPLRGLIRTGFLRGEGITEPADPELNHVEFGFLARLAARGTFRAVPETLYFKRFHRESAHGTIAEDAEGPRRRAWINMGDELLAAAQSCADPSDHARIVAQIMDRLVIERPGRAFFQRDAGGDAVSLLVRDFFALTAWEPPDVEKFDVHDPRWSHHALDAAVIDGLRAEFARSQRRRSTVRIGSAGMIPLELAVSDAGPGVDWLGYGWSSPEPIGAWTCAGRATLHLASTAREVELRGYAFGTPGSVIRVGWSSADGHAVWRQVQAGAETTIVAPLDADRATGSLTLLLPDAARPCDISGSSDSRLLGFLLREIAFR